MNENISLRKAETDDIEQIKAILFGALSEFGIELPENYSVADIDSIRDKNDGNHVSVLVRDDTVIGFVVLRPVAKDRMELKRIYLDASQRGRGLGRYLLDYAIHYAKENDFKSICLETTSRFFQAVSFYRKYGFLELKDVEKAPGHDLAFEKILDHTSATDQMPVKPVL